MTERMQVFFDSDGETCAAYLYRPDKVPGPVPCVVMGHGATINMDSLFPLAERFAAANIAALVFDYRYLGASGGQPRQLLDARQQREDWRAAIRCARRCQDIDPERIALWGTSFSGGHVLAVAATDPRIAAVIAQVPLIDAWRGGPSVKRPVREVLNIFVAAIRDAIRGFLGLPPYLIPLFGNPGETAQFTDPKLKPLVDALKRESPTWRNEFTPRFILTPPRYHSGMAQQLKMPLLICIADKDENASPTFAAYVASQAPQGEVKHYPVGHFDVYYEMNREVFEQVIADQITFLRTHLLPSTIHKPSSEPKEPVGS